MILDGKATAAAIRAALREKIEKDREKAGRAPVHILYGELRASLPDIPDRQLRDTLNALWREGAIGTGRTINDTYITLNREETT